MLTPKALLLAATLVVALSASGGNAAAADDGNCTVTFRMTTDATVGNLGWEIVYTDAPGKFAGEGDDVDCTALAPVLLAKFDDDGESTLTLGWIAPQGVAGTTDIVECTFVPTAMPKKDDFVVTVTEAGDTETNDIVPLPVVEVSISCAPVCGNDSVDGSEECDDGDVEFHPGDFCTSDCTRIPCGAPHGELPPKGGDALYILSTSVGSRACDLRVCDVNGSGVVTASDALLVLEAAVGLEVSLVCPL